MGKGQNRGKIKPPEANKGAHLTVLNTQNYNKIPVIFSLRHIQNGKYCFSQLDQKQKSDFAEALFRRKDFTWNDYHTVNIPAPFFSTLFRSHIYLWQKPGRGVPIAYVTKAGAGCHHLKFCIPVLSVWPCSRVGHETRKALILQGFSDYMG